MNILVLDTIHGGLDIARDLRGMGHFVDTVDVYRGRAGIDPEQALLRDYDLVVSPVHLDPGHPVLRGLPSPRITHHQAVRWILGRKKPRLFVEITGKRGKTTTAWAVASLMKGPGVLHTSTGTFRFPERELLWRESITPASVIAACREAVRIDGWLVAEISLGFIGAGDLGIVTSDEDYLFANGKRHARDEKIRSGLDMPRLLVTDSVDCAGAVRVGDLATTDGDLCRIGHGSFRNPLLLLEGYRTPLLLGAAAGSLLGLDTGLLASFKPVEGRMEGRWIGHAFVVDNSNSGTGRETTLSSAEYARKTAGAGTVTLVIGQEERAVCEGFSAADVEATIAAISPERVIIVGRGYEGIRVPDAEYAGTLDEARRMALAGAPEGAVVLAVKCWR